MCVCAGTIMTVCVYLGVVHVPLQCVALCVQYEVASLEATAALLLLNIQEATHTVLPVHVWHSAACYHISLRDGEWEESICKAF